MNLIINTVDGQFLTLTPEMLQEKLGLKSDILSLGIEVSDGNTAITAQSYTCLLYTSDAARRAI